MLSIVWRKRIFYGFVIVFTIESHGNPWLVPMQWWQQAPLCDFSQWWVTRNSVSHKVENCYFCQWWSSQIFVWDEFGDVSLLPCLSEVMLPTTKFYSSTKHPSETLLQACLRWCVQLLWERSRCSDLKMEWCWLWLKEGHWLELAVSDERNEQRHRTQSWKGL